VRRVQSVLGRLGYELRAQRPPAEDLRREKLLASEGIDLVLDVGANVGQYGERLRLSGYRGRIVSFEPLAKAFGELERRAAGDPGWETIRVALGDADGEAEINVAGNSFSSSLLPMGPRHLQSAPESAYIGRENVPTARLDSVWDRVVAGAERPWLKLDVQGYEMNVLAGVGSRLDAIRVVQAELALEPLYDGDVPWRELVHWLEQRGFALAGLEPGFEDPESGRMLQFDGIFVRGQPPP
jgi:FkbM family methyltransferase